MYDRNPGEIDFGLSEIHAREGSSYQESTVRVVLSFPQMLASAFNEV